MLVLDRGRNQQIVIENINSNEKIVIKILRVGCTHAKIGIQAPENILVYRPEIGDKDFWLEKKKAKEKKTDDESSKDESNKR